MFGLLNYDFVKILLNIFVTIKHIYSNVYNGIEYYYIKEKELLYDIGNDEDDIDDEDEDVGDVGYKVNSDNVNNY